MIMLPCKQCGVIFRTFKSEQNRGGGKFCSHSCSKKSQRPTITAAYIDSKCTDGPNGCREWSGFREKGYGRIKINGRNRPVYRIMYEIHHGITLGSNIVVRHTCDNAACCNIDHLINGSQLDNIRDCISRGRHAIGQRNGCAKLNGDDVTKIRALLANGIQGKDIANQFGVHKATISDIAAGKTWRHLQGEAA